MELPGEESRAEGEAKICPSDHSVLSHITKASSQTKLFSSSSKRRREARIFVHINREAPKAVWSTALAKEKSSWVRVTEWKDSH